MRVNRILGVAVAAAALLVGAGMQFTASAATFSPMSANGCNNSVCIAVQGSGQHVVYVETYFSNDSRLFTPGQYVTQTFTNSSGAETYYYYYPDPGDPDWYTYYDRNFPNNTKVCTRIHNSNGTLVSGNPCETIHS